MQTFLFAFYNMDVVFIIKCEKRKENRMPAEQTFSRVSRFIEWANNHWICLDKLRVRDVIDWFLIGRRQGGTGIKISGAGAVDLMLEGRLGCGE